MVTATFPFPRCHHSQIGGDTTTSASWDTVRTKLSRILGSPFDTVTTSTAVMHTPPRIDAQGGTITYSAHWPRVYPGMESFWPFLSILPCAHRTGVAALIDPYRVMRGNYMALNLRASARCEAPSGCALGFVLGVHAVERHTLSGSSPRRTLLVSDVFGGVASSFAPCSAATRSHLHLMASLTDHTARGGVGGVVEPRAWSLSALADGHWEISSVAPGEPQRTVAFSLADSPRARDSASAFVAHVNSAVLTPLEWRNSALQRQSFNTFGHASVVMSLPATEVASPRRDMGVTVSCAECEQRSSGFEEPGQELSVTQFVGDCDGFRCRRTHRVQLGDLVSPPLFPLLALGSCFFFVVRMAYRARYCSVVASPQFRLVAVSFISRFLSPPSSWISTCTRSPCTWQRAATNLQWTWPRATVLTTYVGTSPSTTYRSRKHGYGKRTDAGLGRGLTSAWLSWSSHFLVVHGALRRLSTVILRVH